MRLLSGQVIDVRDPQVDVYKRQAKGSPFGSTGDDRRQWREQGEAVGAAASGMQAKAKQTLGAATRFWRVSA